eukprot:2162990-Ditylum_brightwellii.AAC.1
MILEDKFIWDIAHNKEYLDCKRRLKPGMGQVMGTAIPTIAIATIEKNEKEENVRAKYRICVLGNLYLSLICPTYLPPGNQNSKIR